MDQRRTRGVKLKKRINTVAKGNKAENERITYLESQGYKVLPKPPRFKFQQSTDYFGLWDVVAYKPTDQDGYLYTHWLVEQVKSNSTGGVLKKLKAASVELPASTKARLVVRMDGKRKPEERWRIINLRE